MTEDPTWNTNHVFEADKRDFAEYITVGHSTWEASRRACRDGLIRKHRAKEEPTWTVVCKLYNMGFRGPWLDLRYSSKAKPLQMVSIQNNGIR